MREELGDVAVVFSNQNVHPAAAIITRSLDAEEGEQAIGERGDGGGGRDREDPGPYDSPRDAPAHGGHPSHGADADDGARDRMGGADGNAERAGGEERDGARRF